MLPLMINVESMPIAVIGNGFAAAQRLRVLKESQAADVTTYAPAPDHEVVSGAGERFHQRLPTRGDFESLRFRIAYLCDLPDAETQEIMMWAKQIGALVNVHDQQDLCDFHMPAILRRGNLQVTVSTDGKVAGLSRILRDYLRDRVLGPEWAARVDELAAQRADWVAQRLPFEILKAKVEGYIEERQWLSRDGS